MGNSLDALHRGLDLVGERWTLAMLALLATRGEMRFGELLEQSGISRKVLAAKLSALTEQGLITRSEYQARPRRFRYGVTERGAQLGELAAALLAAADDGALPAVAAGVGAQSAARAAPRDDSVGDEPVSMATFTSRLLEFDPAYAELVVDSVLVPVLRYDDRYRTELVHSLEVYLAANASVSVAAERLYTHRHTVRYRLDRVRELTGLDVDDLADREQLVLALRALDALRENSRHSAND